MQAWVTEQFCGGGDLEIQDAVHIATYLKKNFDAATLKGILMAFRNRLDALDPSWAYRRHTIIDKVPPPAAEEGEETRVFYAAPWQVGFDSSDAMKVGFIVSVRLNIVCNRLGKGSRFPTLTAIENNALPWQFVCSC